MNKPVIHEVVIDEKTYYIGKLDAKTQFHVTRRIGPLLAEVGVHWGRIKTIAQQDSVSDETWMSVLPTLAERLAKLPDETVDYVLDACLSQVKRREEKGAVSVWVAGRIAFEDIELNIMLRLVAEVLRVNLRSFFKELTDVVQLSSS